MPFIKKLCLYFILLLCGVKTFAQSKPAAGNYKLFFEKVYIHTDRELYAGGDDIWFKAYLVNGQTNQSIGSSNNLYVELISPQGEIINRNIIRLDYGLGNGDIKLADTIPAGKYRLRAYTNWMRNFGDNFIFEKVIDIINPSAKPVVATKAQTVKTDVAVSFYPEGGSLIEGVSSIVGVKAVGLDGNGKAIQGTIVNAANDTIANFKTDTLGMGLFTLLPIKGQVYKCTIASSEQLFSAPLPDVLASGLTLGVMWSDTLVNVIINANDAAFSRFSGSVFTLSGKHAGILSLRKQLKLAGTQTLMRIPKSFFEEGITSLTLYDEQNKPHSERLIYIHHPEQGSQLKVVADKQQYGTRDKVTINLKLADTSAKANLSMAVVDESVSPVPAQNIDSYLLLRSELKGNIQYPARYFDTTNAARFKQLDLLMLTQGWRDFIWRRVADSAIHLSYVAENGFNITGKVRQKLANHPIADMNITLTAFKAKGQKLYAAKTDSMGRFFIEGLQLYGNQPLILTARNNKGTRSGWLLMDSITAEPLTAMAVPKFMFVADTNTRFIKTLKIRQASIKKATGINMLKEVKIKDNRTVILHDISAATFGYPDQEFNITKKDQYFEALDNWLAHNIKGAQIDDHPGVYFIGHKFYPPGIPSTPGWIGKIDPRFIVNGREVTSDLADRDGDPDGADLQLYNAVSSVYYNLTMDKVKKVNVRHLIGNEQGAIVDVFLLYLTITPDALENKDFGLEHAETTGYYEARTFYKPMYDVPADKNKPDLRKTIHWEPNIVIGKNGQATITFYNADVKNKMRVIVEGITDKGVPVVASAGYEVR